MGAKTIYSRWILESAPKPFSKNFELYLEKALCHLSLAFEERKYSGGNSLEKHIEYCKQILDVYSEVIRCIGSRLSCKHWNTILRILLGISTYILEVPISSQGISNELTDQMLRTLFDCLIQSKTKTSDHWSLLSEYTQRWIHREQ